MTSALPFLGRGVSLGGAFDRGPGETPVLPAPLPYVARALSRGFAVVLPQHHENELVTG